MRLGILLAVIGCSGAPEPSSLALEPPVAAPVPDGESRPWRRMDLEQLDASVRKVTGGIGWVDNRGQSQFLALSETLGGADYREGRPEDLSVTLLFLKFLEDAAGNVCTELVERESAATDENVFLTEVTLSDTVESNPTGVNATLAQALLRFHGRSVAPDSPELEPWRFLFESATLVAGSPREGWRTVCVGLLTHPDFYTY